ncbi:hypothetical protein GGER_05010 [Serratia rubidaea]
MNEKNFLKVKFLNEASEWYENQRAKNGAINTNVMNAGLVVSRMIADGLPISDERLYSNGKSQVRGLSGATIAKILEQNGETRIFTREGGRTSRGTINLAASFRDVINSIKYSKTDILDTKLISSSLESFLRIVFASITLISKGSL